MARTQRREGVIFGEILIGNMDPMEILALSGFRFLHYFPRRSLADLFLLKHIAFGSHHHTAQVEQQPGTNISIPFAMLSRRHFHQVETDELPSAFGHS